MDAARTGIFYGTTEFGGAKACDVGPERGGLSSASRLRNSGQAVPKITYAHYLLAPLKSNSKSSTTPDPEKQLEVSTQLACRTDASSRVLPLARINRSGEVAAP